MITKDAALEDLKKVEVAVDKLSVQMVIIRVTEILVKLLATIRSNQLLTEDEKKAIKAKQLADREAQQKK